MNSFYGNVFLGDDKLLLKNITEGGNTNDVLTRVSDNTGILNSGIDWQTPRYVPTEGAPGQVLTLTGNDYSWENAPNGLPDGGDNGEVLTWNNNAAIWESPRYVPSGGTNNYVLTYNNNNFSWQKTQTWATTSSILRGYLYKYNDIKNTCTQAQANYNIANTNTDYRQESWASWVFKLNGEDYNSDNAQDHPLFYRYIAYGGNPDLITFRGDEAISTKPTPIGHLSFYCGHSSHISYKENVLDINDFTGRIGFSGMHKIDVTSNETVNTKYILFYPTDFNRQGVFYQIILTPFIRTTENNQHLDLITSKDIEVSNLFSGPGYCTFNFTNTLGSNDNLYLSALICTLYPNTYVDPSSKGMASIFG